MITRLPIGFEEICDSSEVVYAGCESSILRILQYLQRAASVQVAHLAHFVAALYMHMS